MLKAILRLLSHCSKFKKGQAHYNFLIISNKIQNWKNNHFIEHKHSREISWREIEDFLQSEDGKSIISDLQEISLTKMKKLVNTWHEKVNFLKKKNEKEGEDFHTVISFEDGFCWNILNSQNAYENEGLMMSHCVSTYYRRKSPSSIIFSLRTPHNISKITMEYNFISHTIIQAQSRRNNIISLKYRNYLTELLNQLQDKNENILQKIKNIHKELRQYLGNSSLRYPDMSKNGIFLNLENKFNYITPQCDVSTKSIIYHPSMKMFGMITSESFQIDGEELQFLQNTTLKTDKLIITNSKPDQIIPLLWTYNNIEKNSFFHINTNVYWLPWLSYQQAIGRAFRGRTVILGDYHILFEKSREKKASNSNIISTNQKKLLTNTLKNSNTLDKMHKTVSGYNPEFNSEQNNNVQKINFNLKNNLKLENKEKEFSLKK